MSNFIENAFLLGLGALSISKNAAESLIQDAIKKAELTPTEGDSLLKTFTTEGEKAKENIENAVKEIIKTKGASLIPGAEKIAELEAKIAELEEKISKLEAK